MTYYTPIVSRRQTLAWLAATLGSVMLPRMSSAAVRPIEQLGYGQDPRLDSREAPWPRLLNAGELTQLAILSDLILPAGPDSPAPSSLGIPDFLNEWVSAPYPQQLQDREVIRAGLENLDKASLAHGGSTWSAASEPTRHAILLEFADSAALANSASKSAFFLRIRQLVVSAYYTTAPGMRVVGYVGNVPLAAYPGVTGELQVELARRMRNLGL